MDFSREYTDVLRELIGSVCFHRVCVCVRERERVCTRRGVSGRETVCECACARERAGGEKQEGGKRERGRKGERDRETERGCMCVHVCACV